MMEARMMHSSQVYMLFANLLAYPSIELAEQVDASLQLLATRCPAEAESLVGFHDFIAQTSLGKTQEIYTYTFDLQGTCPPYVGHHLFGESYKRSTFMSLLNQGYAQKNYSSGCELPDHVAVVLGYLAEHRVDEFDFVLQNEGLIPAVDMMLKLFREEDGNPYRGVIAALSIVLHDPTLVGSQGSLDAGEGGIADG